MFRWQIREPYFKGPGVYEIGQCKISVDRHGYFDVESPVKDVAFGVFARPLGERKRKLW